MADIANSKVQEAEIIDSKEKLKKPRPLRRLRSFGQKVLNLPTTREIDKKQKNGFSGRITSDLADALVDTSSVGYEINSGNRAKAFEYGITERHCRIKDAGGEERRATLPIKIEPDSEQAELLNYIFRAKTGQAVIDPESPTVVCEAGFFTVFDVHNYPEPNRIRRSGIGVYITQDDQTDALLLRAESLENFPSPQQDGLEQLAKDIKQNAATIKSEVYQSNPKSLNGILPPVKFP